MNGKEFGRDKTYTAEPPDHKLQFNLTKTVESDAFAILIDRLQATGARWRLQQDGMMVWVCLGGV
jgi:hypothetical protein